MRYLFLYFSLVAILAASAPANAQDAKQRIEWNQPAAPFRIVDNVYYVGTSGLAAYLVTGRRGHVLIDGGLPESAPLIAANVERLGFNLKDVRYLLINHAHFDHAGGLAQLKRRTGARLVANGAEKRDLESGSTRGRPELDHFPPVRIDRAIRDGEELRLGDIQLRAVLTPGHTRGCTSWLLTSPKSSVLFACSLTVAGQNLIDDPTYPAAAADFRRTFQKLRAIKADTFLNFHPDFFDLDEKRARQLSGNEDAFIDSSELARQVRRAEQGFAEELSRQRQAKGTQR